MVKTLTLILVIATMSTFNLAAQDLSDYRGKNRLLIMVADDITHPNYALQIKELHKDTKGVKERRLEIVHVTPEAYQIGLYPGLHWNQSEEAYRQYKRPNTVFEVILVGLDGGVKSRRTNVFPINDLFDVIDAMPFRKAEIKYKNQ